MGALNLPIILEHVHGFQTVSERRSRSRFYLTKPGLAEPTGALTLAALLSLAEDHPLRSSVDGRRSQAVTLTVLTSPDCFRQLIQTAAAASGSRYNHRHDVRCHVA